MAHSELDQILADEALHVLLQPIVAWRQGRVFGYEALIRGPSNTALHSPVTLFDAATRAGRLAELDLTCRRLAMRHFAELGLPGRLFVNVTPGVIAESGFRRGETLRYLEEVGLAADRIVIELTEHYPVQDYDVMRAAVQHYREMGFAIAIDDLGAGYSSLRLWSELHPNFVKIDRHFVQGVDQDAGKQEFIRSILEMAGRLKAEVMERSTLTFGRPACAP